MKKRLVLAALCLGGALLVLGESSAKADHFRRGCGVKYADSCSLGVGYSGYGYYSGIAGGYPGDYRGIYRGFHDGPRYHSRLHFDRGYRSDFYYRTPDCRFGY